MGAILAYLVRNQTFNLILDLLLAITCVLGVQMGHMSQLYTFTSQDRSNDKRNVLIQWVLTLAIAL